MTRHLHNSHISPAKSLQEHVPYRFTEILPRRAVQYKVNPKVGIEQQIANLLRQLHRSWRSFLLLELYF